MGVRFGNTSGYFKCDCELFFFLSLFVFFKKCFGLVVRFLFLGGLLLQGLTMYVVQLAMASPEFKWVNAELEDSY